MRGTAETIRTWIRRVILIMTAAMVLYIGLTVWSGSGALRSSLSMVRSGSTLPLVLGLVLTGWFIRAYRWHFFTRTLNWTVPVGHNFLVFLASFAFTATPGKMGEIVKAGLLRSRYGTSITETFAILFAERLGDLIAVFLLALGGMTVFVDASVYLLVSGAVIALLTFLIVYSPARRMVAAMASRVAPAKAMVERVERFLSSAVSLFRFVPFVTGLALALVAWACEAVAFALILEGVGIGVPVVTIFFIYGFSTIIGALSMMPGGIGSMEAAMLLLLAAVGVPAATAVIPVILVRACTLWFVSILGFGFLLLWWIAVDREFMSIRLNKENN
ncbi:MAG: lysylphosphatidylglycerol synthase transmembrane domain-containing protein [bacterium]|nr:lysylphosphatidylglycerol synthase transmembrane domain-containing protein [bacterium]MDT8395057.1 lysylphosphatidylglycerol synthase transmembrane domain-containing protein [bacterium]